MMKCHWNKYNANISMWKKNGIKWNKKKISFWSDFSGNESDWAQIKK